jgi:hypothetical protein
VGTGTAWSSLGAWTQVHQQVTGPYSVGSSSHNDVHRVIETLQLFNYLSANLHIYMF